MGLVKKVASKVLAKIVNRPKTKDEVTFELSTLDPKAQYLTSITRPVISISLVYVLIIGVFIQWIQQMLNVPDIYRIEIPKYIINFSKIIVGAFVGSRGIEKIVKEIFK